MNETEKRRKEKEHLSHIYNSLYCNAINGIANPGFLQNQNGKGIYNLLEGMVGKLLVSLGGPS